MTRKSKGDFLEALEKDATIYKPFFQVTSRVPSRKLLNETKVIAEYWYEKDRKLFAEPLRNLAIHLKTASKLVELTSVKKDAISPDNVFNAMALAGIVGGVLFLAYQTKKHGAIETFHMVRKSVFGKTRDFITKTFQKTIQEAKLEAQKKNDMYEFYYLRQLEFVLVTDGLGSLLKRIVTFPFRLIKKIVQKVLARLVYFFATLSSWVAKVLKPIAYAARKIDDLVNNKLIDWTIGKALKFFTPNPLVSGLLTSLIKLSWASVGFPFVASKFLGGVGLGALVILNYLRTFRQVQETSEMIGSIKELIDWFNGSLVLEDADPDKAMKELKTL